MERAFGKLNRKATEEAFKQYLLEWKPYRLKALSKRPVVSSPSMDGQPNDGTPHDPDARAAAYVDAMRPCREREGVCHTLASISEEEEVLGDLLLHRFIKRWGPTKTMLYLNDKYGDYMSDRTFRDRQSQALWEGALMCPDDSVRVPQ